MSINYIVSDRTLTFYVGGKPHQIDVDAAAFPQVRDELNKPNPDPDRLVELADQVNAVRQQIAAAQRNEVAANYLPKGVVNVTRAGVTFNGEVLENALSKRLMDILALGLRIGPWIRFAENLYMNPAEHAREELLLWLENSDLPITEDGCFLAYKKVRNDYKDIHSGSFDNSVGQVVQLEGRDQVDPVRDNVCSVGLHFCSKSYLPNFGSWGGQGGDRVVVLKINPADVVSIPSDYNNAKGRTWRYEVVDEIEVAGITDKVWDPISYDYSDDEYDDDYEDWDDDDTDDALEALLAEEEDLARKIEVEARRLLDSYGIVNLRRMASSAGLNSNLAWKVYSKEQLANFVAERTV